VKDLRVDTSGATAIEYAMIAGLVSIVTSISTKLAVFLPH
jgi:Flp pilus assembly pilin Flp